MKKHITPSLLAGLLACAVWLTGSASAQMNYQGRLTDSSGNPLADGQYTVTFNLYDAPSGGSQVWGPFLCDGAGGTGHATKADLVNGRFNVILGALDVSSRTLPSGFAGGSARYLGITVGVGGTEISPRQQLLAAPEALHAKLADGVIDGAIGTAQLADGSVTAAKINGGTGVWVGSGNNIYHDAGNVGIGTTNPVYKLDVNGNGQFQNEIALRGNNGPGFSIYGNNNGSQMDIGLATSAGQYNSSAVAGDAVVRAFGSKKLFLQSGVTTALCIDANNNVGIGLTSPAARLDVRRPDDTPGDAIAFGSHTYGMGRLGEDPNTNLVYLANVRPNDGVIDFRLGSAPVVSIKAPAAVGAPQFANTLNVDGVVRATAFRGKAGSAGAMSVYDVSFYCASAQNPACHLFVDGNDVGQIGATPSDRRLKEQISPMTDSALQRVMSLKPVSFKFKTSTEYQSGAYPGTQEGFIADELQEVIPSGVSGEKDAVTSDGKIQPQTVNPIPVVAVLTKATQELAHQLAAKDAEIQALKQSVAELQKAVLSLAEKK